MVLEAVLDDAGAGNAVGRGCDAPIVSTPLVRHVHHPILAMLYTELRLASAPGNLEVVRRRYIAGRVRAPSMSDIHEPHFLVIATGQTLLRSTHPVGGLLVATWFAALPNHLRDNWRLQSRILHRERGDEKGRDAVSKGKRGQTTRSVQGKLVMLKGCISFETEAISCENSTRRHRHGSFDVAGI